MARERARSKRAHGYCPIQSVPTFSARLLCCMRPVGAASISPEKCSKRFVSLSTCTYALEAQAGCVSTLGPKWSNAIGKISVCLTESVIALQFGIVKSSCKTPWQMHH